MDIDFLEWRFLSFQGSDGHETRTEYCKKTFLGKTVQVRTLYELSMNAV